MNPIARKNLPLYVLAAILAALTVYGVLYAYSVGGPAGIPRRSPENALGKSLGVVAFFSIGSLYGRTVLKRIMRSDHFASTDPSELQSLAGALLSFLNVTHPYVGLVAVSSTFLHCAFTNSLRDNLFLYLVLFLVFLEGLTGMLMKIPGVPPVFFRGNLFLHSRFFLGIVLVLLTFVGHLLVKF